MWYPDSECLDIDSARAVRYTVDAGQGTPPDGSAAQKGIFQMITAHEMTERNTANADERQTLIDEIRAILPRLTREQKEALLERLEALVGDEVTVEEAAD
jgi:hypothetical protein